jgi:hypothetical protein
MDFGSKTVKSSQHNFKQLFNSFERLEQSIAAAREVVLEQGQDGNGNLIARLEEYEKVLASQRSYAENMCRHAARKEWYEVSRHIQIINSLSRMIRDDAREVISGVDLQARGAQGDVTNQ